jgi:glycosyltransferase involved in cell wall biosynthesis
MRIAFFTPLNPVRTALADIAEGLLPYWAQRLDITVVTNGTYQPSHAMFQPGNGSQIPWITYDAFKQRAGTFDLIVYNLGDEPNIHGYMFEALHRYPGLVLLHDLVLHHAIAGLTWAKGKLEAYIEELRYSYGAEAERLAQEVVAGRYEEVFTQYPLVERVLDSSLGIVGFNEHMCSQVRAMRPDLVVRCIPYPYYLPEGFQADFDGIAFRRSLGLADCPVVASFGLFNSQKRLELALRAFKRLTLRHPDAVYLLVGSYIDPDLEGRLRAVGLAGRVRQMGWQPPAAFAQYMLAVDVAVHLRYPHVGGTPYTPIRLLGLGVPTIISDIEPLAMIPSDAVVRITPNQPDEEAMVFAAMDYLLTHRDVAQALGQNARRYIQSAHNLPAIAAQHVEFMREVTARRGELQEGVYGRREAVAAPLATGDDLARVTGAALAEMGAPPGSRWLQPVAAALHDLGARKQSRRR